jgi:hypothetical protein
MAHHRGRKRRPPLGGEDRLGPYVLDAERGCIRVRSRLDDRPHVVSLVGAHARLELTKAREEGFDEERQTPVTWSYRHEEFVIEGPDGRVLSAPLHPHLGSKAEAKAFARRVNEVARAVSGGSQPRMA